MRSRSSVLNYYTHVVDTQGAREAYGESVTATAAEIAHAALPGKASSAGVQASHAAVQLQAHAHAAIAPVSTTASTTASPVTGRSRRRAREYQRIAVRCGCWLEHEQATVFGTTVDLGRGGLFLRTALPMPPGVSVRVTLRLPGQETVVADGKIVRNVAPHSGDRPGLGVRFDRLPNGEDSLCAFLFGSLRAEQEDAELASAG